RRSRQMSMTEPSETIRILSVSDSESYLKWATQLLTGLPDIDGRVVLIDNPILPTAEQIRDAVAGTAWQHRHIPVTTRPEPPPGRSSPKSSSPLTCGNAARRWSRACPEWACPPAARE